MGRLTLIVALATAIAGCNPVTEVERAIDGPFHRLSPADLGVYLTIKRHATNAMIAVFDGCTRGGKSDQECGTETLRISRTVVEPALRGRAREVWNGEYEVFRVYRPHLGKGFRDEEGDDFATAVGDLRSRGHECLRVHWKPSGTNWTTVNDEGVAECEWGEEVRAG